MKISKKGLSREELFKKLDERRANDLNWQSGKVFGYVFDPGKEAMEIGKEVYSKFLTENALDFSVFPSLLNFETELVAIAAEHLSGDKNVVGNFTSGGTESIILAVKAARDYCRVHKPKIKDPEMVLPVTAHAAFHKAARYLNVKVVLTPVDETFRAIPAEVKKAITPNTILLVGSAPSYAHGVVDPIKELGEVALENNVLLHTDACVGGFMLPYFKRLGEPIPDFDFCVPGVTSISIDLHKYAYTPKGASLVLYRSKDLRKHQIFACSHWTGYTIINNAVQSSRSGGPMAAAWAVLNYIGDEGYLNIARKKLEATKKIVEGIEKIKDLRLMTKPDMCMLSFTSDTISVFHLIDEMNSIGWYIQPALTFENSKENIHLSINYSNVEWVDDFLVDLEKCVEKVRPVKFGELGAAIQAQFAKMNPDELTDELFSEMLGMAGIEGAGLPEKMADINEVLNGLPAELRERLLIEFINNLFVFSAK
ncbi:MAG: aspartate aminotransferase family protein [Desulfobacterales bacterium]|nr:aspartate aminotransferase family protein [Desulfobacterales bacterium]